MQRVIHFSSSSVGAAHSLSFQSFVGINAIGRQSRYYRLLYLWQVCVVDGTASAPQNTNNIVKLAGSKDFLNAHLVAIIEVLLYLYLLWWWHNSSDSLLCKWNAVKHGVLMHTMSCRVLLFESLDTNLVLELNSKLWISNKVKEQVALRYPQQNGMQVESCGATIKWNVTQVWI